MNNSDTEQKRKIKKVLSIASVVLGAIITVAPLLFILSLKFLPCSEGGCMVFVMPMGLFIQTGAPFFGILAVVLGLFGISKKEDGKISPLPLLGILLGILGIFLVKFAQHAGML